MFESIISYLSTLNWPLVLMCGWFVFAILWVIAYISSKSVEEKEKYAFDIVTLLRFMSNRVTSIQMACELSPKLISDKDFLIKENDERINARSQLDIMMLKTPRILEEHTWYKIEEFLKWDESLKIEDICNGRISKNEYDERRGEIEELLLCVAKC